MSKKILSVVGARPQFIKMAAFHRATLNHDINHYIVHTGQHYDANMSNIFFEEMNIPKAHQNLGIGGGTHGENTGRMIEKLEKVLTRQAPDWLVVFGDTDSTLAASIAATKIQIPIAHVEAGLRSFNRSMPEEVNRVLTDHVSDLLFTATDSANENLKKEGIPDFRVHTCGDIMFDVALFYKNKKNTNSILSQLSLRPNEYILATVHRAENTSSMLQMQSVVEALSILGQPTILPLHPRTAYSMKQYGLGFSENVKVIEPVGYLDMLALEANAKFIVTDSGGVQKEAYFHEKPCITLRNETEWVELVDAKVNFIVGLDIEQIHAALKKISNSTFDFSAPFYGNGDSADKMVEILLSNTV